MKKHLSAILASALALVLLMSACGPAASNPTNTPGNPDSNPSQQQENPPADQPITITYSNFNASGGNEETLQKMYEAFHQEYPNITVEIETIAFSDYFTQLQTRVAGGTAPDCFELNIENFSAYANKGALAEITGVDFSGLDDTSLNAFNVDGKQYGLPGKFSNVVLFYNKDLFDQAKIGYPTADWTQDDLQKAAEAIRALGDDIYGYYQPLTYNEFYKVAAQFGGSLLNKDKTEFTINTPENVAAAQMMADRILVSNVQPTEVQMGGIGDWDLFMSGRLGMMPTGIWAFNTFTEGCKFDWDITVEPGKNQKATHFFSDACCINASAAADKQAAAATWITWLTSSGKSAAIRIEAGWDLPAIKDQATLSAYLDITPPANRQAVFDSLNYLVVPPVIEDYSMMSDIIGQKLAAAAAGTITVQEALDQAQSECQAQISLK